MRKFLVCLLAAALAAPALAEKVGSEYVLQSHDGMIGVAPENLTTLGSPRQFNTVVDISGMDSMDGWGAPVNVVFTVPLAPNAWITGIGWDTNQFADSPSWLSEMIITMTDTAITGGVDLAPGVGDNFSGVGSYSSGGIVDLIGLGLDFYLGGDGLLRFELWESFVDYPNDWDGYYMDPSIITIEWVPEPASLVLLALGGLAALRRR